MDANTISRQIHIKASPARVWEALTDASAFGTWFHVALDGPFKVGETTTGTMTYPGHEGVAWTSVTEVMEREKQFVFRWPHTPSGDLKGVGTVWLTVSFTLEPRDNGTLLTVTETGFAALPDGDRVSMLRDNAQGWEIQTGNVKRYVEG